jgi:hypothetical protein
METPSVTGLNGSPSQYFLESLWQGKTVQILFAIGFFSLIYYVASRFIKRDGPPSQDPATLNNRGVTDKTTPPLLKEITESTWKEKIDCEKYGLDFTGAPRINGPALAKRLQALSKHVEDNMGITHIVIPKGLTLKKVLQIAKENSVPISTYWFDEIITEFGDIPAEQTRVLFFTNSILKGTRNHTSDQHAADVANIGKECGVAIQRPNVRDFMAFLVLTYLNSPKDDPVRFYSSKTFTRLLEKVGTWSLCGGFAPSGLYADRNGLFAPVHIGVGASGSSQDIVT